MPVSRTVGLVALTAFFLLLAGLPVLRGLGISQGIALFEAFYRSGALVFGGGHVVLPCDAGQTWRAAKLGPDLGRYSFREWQTLVRLPAGKHELKVRAINRIGQSQPMAPLWNPAGYMRNVAETVRVQAG